MATAKDPRTKSEPPPAPLVEQYRDIGPAALLAALLCAPRTRLKMSKPDTRPGRLGPTSPVTGR
jgi:hypothetical protein